MKQYEYIRTGYRRYGMNISELARQTGHSRNTIKKAIRGEPWKYRDREQQPYPVLGPYLSKIDEWLLEDKSAPKKQRHTARRVYNRLVSELDYEGGESTVRRYVRNAKLKLGIDSSGAFIPCDPEAGIEAEVDWGSAVAIIDGRRRPLKFFCMRSKYSGKHFVRVYPCERQQAFLDAHLHAFQFFGGVFPVLIYDNLTTAVREVLKGKGRVEQEAFRKFRAYHSIEARFTNPASGNEKGGVEGIVGFCRRNYMVPIPQADSFDVLNDQLLVQCQNYGRHTISGRDQSVNELHEAEKSWLLALPSTVFNTDLLLSCKVDKYATVFVDKNRYSVPTVYHGREVSVLLGVDKVQIYLQSRQLASHERKYGNNKWELNPHHYLKLLRQRPMAFESARPIRQWRKEWPKALEKLRDRLRDVQGESAGTKDFISVLMLYQDFSSDEMESAVEQAIICNISSSEGIKHLLAHSKVPQEVPPALGGWDSLPPADITPYSQLEGLQ